MVETKEAPIGVPEKLRRAPVGRLDGGFDLFNGQGFRGVYLVLDAKATSVQRAAKGDVSLAVVAGALRIKTDDVQADLALHDGFYLPPALTASLSADGAVASLIRVEATTR
jgi:hypothetical protein